MSVSETHAEPFGTRHDLLHAAERLFAENGFRGASLRAITQEAGANLASVNYHFGSKEGLIRAVFSHRLEPLNHERLELLEACETESEKPSLECVVRAFIAPVIRMARTQGPGGSDFIRLLARAAFEGGDFHRQIFLDQFHEVFERFSVAFADALPHLDKKHLFWRFHFMVGAMVHTAGGGFVAADFTGSFQLSDEIETVIDDLVAFLAAGMPVTGPDRKEGSS